MDHVLAAAVAALVLLATAVWPRLAGAWLTWPGTPYKIGRLSRLGLGVVYASLAVVLLIADGAVAEWWYAYAGLVVGIGLTLVGYRGDSRTSVAVETDFARR